MLVYTVSAVSPVHVATGTPDALQVVRVVATPAKTETAQIWNSPGPDSENGVQENEGSGGFGGGGGEGDGGGGGGGNGGGEGGGLGGRAWSTEYTRVALQALLAWHVRRTDTFVLPLAVQEAVKPQLGGQAGEPLLAVLLVGSS
jgi:hypothetical protein